MNKAEHLKRSAAARKAARTRALRIARRNVKRRAEGKPPLNQDGKVARHPRKPEVSGLKPVKHKGVNPGGLIREPKHKVKHRKATGAVAGEWISGGNDVIPCCAAAAVANSLLACTGWRVTDEQVIALHVKAAGSLLGAASIEDVLMILAEEGLAGMIPSAMTPGVLGHGAIAGLSVPGWEPHAVAVTDHGVISWGAGLNGGLLAHADEAWQLTW